MINDKDIKKSKQKKGTREEETTKFGEFVSSYFGWVSLTKQKERAEELDNMTKKED